MKNKTLFVFPLLILALIASGCNGVNFSLSTKTTPPAATEKATVPVEPTTVPVSPTQPPAQPQAQAAAPLSGLLAAYEGALENVYSTVNPSVVNLRVLTKASGITTSTQPDLPSIPGFPFDLPGQQNQSQAREALGSGFVWDKDGHIVTNNHVISGADKVTVTFSDGTILEGKVVGADPDSDLAVVKVDAKSDLLSPVQIADSNSVKVGEIAIAIGNPFGLQGTMTVGIISALGRSLPAGTDSSTSGSTKNFTIPNIIQTDAPINPGNSGGVLVNDIGQVIGVTAAIESPVRANAGIGFAIPSSIVKKIVPELVKNGKVEHPWVGIMGTTLTPDLAKAMNLSTDQRGILVIEVTSGSPADKAGLKGSDKEIDIDGSTAKIGGDVITAINGQTLKDFDTLVAYLSTSTNVNDSVQLSVLRAGKTETLSLTLTARPVQTENNQGSQPSQTTGKARLGVTVTDMNAEIANAMNLPQDTKGVLVEKIQQGSPAEKAGMVGSSKTLTVNGKELLVGGDVITKMDQKSITSTDDLISEIGQHKIGDVITLTVLRDGKEIEVKVTL